jgi:hypothetical protein
VGKQALVGAYERQQETYGATFVNIAATEVHPQFDSDLFENDFLLLKLSSSINVVNPTLSLNFDDDVPAVGEDLTIIGVGATEQGSFQADFLRDVVVKTVTTDECNDSYRNSNGDDQIFASMFCAGNFIESILSV